LQDGAGILSWQGCETWLLLSAQKHLSLTLYAIEIQNILVTDVFGAGIFH
jgi:hypothetical protein